MTGRFRVTYEIVTPESAAEGDVAERGLLRAGEERVEMPADCVGEAARVLLDSCNVRLREALDMVGHLESSGNGLSWYETDGRQDYATGADERRALHLPDNATAASAARVSRVLALRRLIHPREAS